MKNSTHSKTNLTRRHILLGLWTTGCVTLGGYNLSQFLQAQHTVYPSSLARKLVWSPTGQRIARFNSTDTPVEVSDAFTGTNSTQLNGLGISDLAWSPDSLCIATVEQNERIIIWDTQIGKDISYIPTSNSKFWANSVAYSPDGRLLLVGGIQLDNRKIVAHLYTIASKQIVQTFKIEGDNHSNQTVISWSPNGKYIAIHLDDEAIQHVSTPNLYIYDATNASILDIYRGSEITKSENYIHHQWSHDSKHLAISNSTDQNITIFNVNTQGKLSIIHKKPQKDPYAVNCAWSPQENVIASVEDGIIHIWDALTGNVLHKLPKPTGTYINSLAWSPDGTYLAAGLSHDDVGQTWIWQYK